MNVTKTVAVQHTVDVLPTPQSPRDNPLESPLARTRSPRPGMPLRESEVMQQVREAVAKSHTAGAEGERLPKLAESLSSTDSRPRWMRKVQAWLDGRWGIGHKRKPS